MPNLELRKEKESLPEAMAYDPADGLWRVVPKRDGEGRSCADFMMLMPGLKCSDQLRRQQVTILLKKVFDSFGDQILFADVNFRLNVLWVSVVAECGLCAEVASAIQEVIPDARLVGGHIRKKKQPLRLRLQQSLGRWLPAPSV